VGEAGATVVVTGRSSRENPSYEGLPGTVEDTADEVTRRGGTGDPMVCDHTDDAAVEAVLDRVRERYGRLDALVNNAWGGYENYDRESFNAPFWNQPMQRWDAMMTAGARATFLSSRSAAPLLREGGSGAIVNVSYGERGKYLGSMIYDLSKTAIDRMVFAMAHELRDDGVAVVGLYPGFTRTERNVRYYRDPTAGDQTPEFSGRAVASLLGDPRLGLLSGEILDADQVAERYGFTDRADASSRPAARPESS
jgi:NAD(P)-dependent dehydrogenase (short-subunit alcohol dehydrogenase family)